MKVHTFQAATKLIWDADVSPTLATLVSDNGWTKVGVIVDGKLRTAPLVNELLSALREVAEVQVSEPEVSEPDTDYVDNLTSQFRINPPEVLIGVGGGSIIDLTKAVAVLLTNPGPASDYQGFNLVKNPGLPTIAVPTTAGTGAEVTWTAVFTNRTKMIKGGINSPHLFPRFAVLDPKLTISMPRRVTFASGMDALSHAVESYTAKNASLLSRLFSVEAFKLLTQGLLGVFEDDNDLEARRRTQLGSTIAGWACFNAGTGACHSLAYPLGVYFGVPHGEALSMLLPTVMRINHDKEPGMYASLWDAVSPGASTTLDNVDKSIRLIEHVDKVIAGANLNFHLTDYGARAPDLDSLSQRGLDLKSALSNNPVEFGQQDARKALESIL